MAEEHFCITWTVGGPNAPSGKLQKWNEANKKWEPVKTGIVPLVFKGDMAVIAIVDTKDAPGI